MQIKITTSFEDEKINEVIREYTLEDIEEAKILLHSVMKVTQNHIDSIDKDTLSEEELQDSHSEVEFKNGGGAGGGDMRRATGAGGFREVGGAGGLIKG